jgi:hypothetical protein
MRSSLAFAALSGAVVVTAPTLAHHSPARFDLARVVTLDGMVARYDFTNPHVYIYIDVAGADGEVTTWELEASSTPNLVRRGWGPDSLHVGERITVDVNPPRDGAVRTARAQIITFDDGRRLAVRGGGSVVPPAAADVRADALAGVWLGRYGLAQVGTNLASWPLTAQGRAAQEAYDGSQNPHIDCIPVAAPSLMLYSNVYTVAVEPTIVTIDIEWMDSKRVIHLADARSFDSVERTNQGYSVGRWENGALVVETRRFTDNGAGNAFEIPSGAQKSVIERFELANAGRELHYEFVLEDPEYLAEPVTGEGTWDFRPDLSPLPNQCDPEIARRFLGRD